MSDEEEFIDPTTSPAAANAATQALLTTEAPEVEIPTIPAPPETFSKLPAGFETDEDKVLRTLEVRELTGVHEEKIAKARQSTDPNRFLQVLLECGTVSIGGEKPSPDLLRGLLVGDREYIALAIREATYGSEIEYGEIICEECREAYDLVVPLSDIPIRTLDGDRIFEVPLRKGGKATLRIPDGFDQEIYTDPESDLNQAERNSVLLGRIILSIEDAAGNETFIAGQESVVRDLLGVADRQRVIAAVNDRQVGPLYDEVIHKHDCGNEMLVPVDMMRLFPGL